MKTKNRIALGLLMITNIAFAQEQTLSGGQDGNAGAGIIQEGIPTTFYSAGFYVDPKPLVAKRVPALNELIQFIREKTRLTDYTKTQLIKSLAPINGRGYYQVPKSHFSDETYREIKAEYAKVTGAPLKDLEIHAITQNLTTYLLPSYFELRSIHQQQAILMHEDLWVFSPKHSYAHVVRAEMASQAFFENPQDPTKELEFTKYFGNRVDLLIATLNLDIASGNLGKLVQKDRSIPLTDYFGKPFLSCLSCGNDLVAVNIFELGQAHPYSMFLSEFQPSYLSFSRNGHDRENCGGSYGGSFNCIPINQLTRTKNRIGNPSDSWKTIVDIDYSRCKIVLNPRNLTALPYPLSRPSGNPEPKVALPVSCESLPEGLYLEFEINSDPKLVRHASRNAWTK